MTIAVDLGRKATKPTNQQVPVLSFEKVNFEKGQQTKQQKHEKLPSMQRVNGLLTLYAWASAQDFGTHCIHVC